MGFNLLLELRRRAAIMLLVRGLEWVELPTFRVEGGGDEPKGGVGVGKGTTGAEVLVRWGMLRERERGRAPLLGYSEPSREGRSRRNRGQAEKSWHTQKHTDAVLFEGIDTFCMT